MNPAKEMEKGQWVLGSIFCKHIRHFRNIKSKFVERERERRRAPFFSLGVSFVKQRWVAKRVETSGGSSIGWSLRTVTE